MSQSPSKKKCCISHKYFNHCVRLSDFPAYSKDSKFTEDMRLTNLLFMTSKLFENITLKIAQRCTVESKCSREIYGHPNSQFNRNLAAVSVFWNIDNAFDTTWHSGLPQKWSKLQFSFGAVRLIWFSCQKENAVFRWKEKFHAWTFYHSIPSWFLYCAVCTQMIFSIYQTIRVCTPQDSERVMFSATAQQLTALETWCKL